MRKLSTAFFVFFIGCSGTDKAAPLDAGTPDAGPTSDAGNPRDAGQTAPDAGPPPPPCDGAAGTFRAQTLEVGVEDRFYFLHVPASYDCDVASALLMDFHGTAGDTPEEAYRNDALIALANRENFIVVRPRSRFSGQGASVVYRWDQNPGDLDRNVRFAAQLLDFLRTRFHIDPKRTYASGFSSGTNMIAQLLRLEAFGGFGFVGGGHWNRPNLPAIAPDAFRVYAVTGYRDYLVSSVPPLFETLTTAGLDTQQIFYAENDAGHELYGWHFEELWAWLDRGERPSDDALEPGWSSQTIGTDDTLIELEAGTDGSLLAATAAGTILRRAPGATAWDVALPTGAVPITGLCVGRDGTAFAVGAQFIYRSTDSGASWSARASAPEFGGQWFGNAYLNDIACPSASLVLAAGYWSAVQSDDAGATWFNQPMHYPGTTFPSQLAAVEVSSSSTAVAAGYFYFGRAGAGGSFTALPMPAGVDWLNGVTHFDERWWVVGEGGTILSSTDDGVSFALQPTPIDDDLYAVHFYDADVGLAVGQAGSALFTTDGGATWLDRHTGHAGFLGGVRFLDATTALVVGEAGSVYVFDSTQ